MTRDFFVRQGIFSTESCRIPRKFREKITQDDGKAPSVGRFVYYQTSPKELLEKYDIADW